MWPRWTISCPFPRSRHRLGISYRWSLARWHFSNKHFSSPTQIHWRRWPWLLVHEPARQYAVNSQFITFLWIVFSTICGVWFWYWGRAVPSLKCTVFLRYDSCPCLRNAVSYRCGRFHSRRGNTSRWTLIGWCCLSERESQCQCRYSFYEFMIS